MTAAAPDTEFDSLSLSEIRREIEAEMAKPAWQDSGRLSALIEARDSKPKPAARPVSREDMLQAVHG